MLDGKKQREDLVSRDSTFGKFSIVKNDKINKFHSFPEIKFCHAVATKQKVSGWRKQIGGTTIGPWLLIHV